MDDQGCGSESRVKPRMAMNLEQVREYWQEAGKTLSLSAKITPTNRDPYLGRLEEEYILPHLEGDQTVLEFGCGDGAHTVEYARAVKSLSGLDVAENLVVLARRRAESVGVHNVDFVVGSILEAGEHFPPNSMDCVISQRCLINLPTWEDQRAAIQQIHNVLRPGGLLLLTEGFQEELENLSRLRESVGLTAIKMVDHNRNLAHHEFDRFTDRLFASEGVFDYGLYLLISRVYYPLEVYPDEPKHDSRQNEVAMQIAKALPTSRFADLSYNLMYVLRKS